MGGVGEESPRALPVPTRLPAKGEMPGGAPSARPHGASRHTSAASSLWFLSGLCPPHPGGEIGVQSSGRGKSAFPPCPWSCWKTTLHLCSAAPTSLVFPPPDMNELRPVLKSVSEKVPAGSELRPDGMRPASRQTPRHAVREAGEKAAPPRSCKGHLPADAVPFMTHRRSEHLQIAEEQRVRVPDRGRHGSSPR